MHARSNEKTVMVIDDILEGEYLYTILIEKLGYQVAFYDDPVLALGVVKRVKPVLAVSDVCMPHMDGYMLLKKIRHVFPNMPFLMVSAIPSNLDRAGNIENCRALEKPFENANFVRLVKDFLMDIACKDKREIKTGGQKSRVWSFPWNRTSTREIMRFHNHCDTLRFEEEDSN